MDATLLLNADYTPISLLPISSMSWQDAVGFIWSEAADALHNYDDWVVHSPSMQFAVPAVAVLRQHVSVEKRIQNVAGPTSYFVFLRDNFQCQYCFEAFPSSRLTVDHVLPKFYGGRSGWDNLSTACEPCNGRRGHDVRIQPARRPIRPSYADLVRNLRRHTLTVPHPSWNLYLRWPEEKLFVLDPRKNKNARKQF